MLPGISKTKLAEVNLSTFLTGMGVSGVVTTSYLTGRASFKAAHILEREKLRRIDTEMLDPDEHEPEMTKKDVVKMVWPLYIAPTVSGAITIGAIVMGNREASKKIAALTAATGISERAFQEYKEKVIEKFGQNKEQGIRDEIYQDRVNKNPPPKEIIIAGAGDVLCFDVLTGRYFISSAERIRQAANRVAFDIIQHMYASLSSFYDEIGLPPTPMSDEVGWNADHPIEVRFSTVMSPDQRPCLAVDFAEAPFPEYARTWG